MKNKLTVVMLLLFTMIASSLFTVNTAAKTNPDPKDDGTNIIYTVIKGDNFYKIAAKNNISYNQLKSLNPQVKNPSLIFVGDKLIVGKKTGAVTPVPTKTPTVAPTAGPAATKAPTPTPVPVKTGVNVNIAALKGPTAMGLVKLMEDNSQKKAANNYSFEIMGTADEVVAKITKGELDIAAVPVNLASTLYNKTSGKVKVLAVNTLGVLYVLDTSGQIKTMADLKGKTIYTTGKGTTPEFALNYVLKQNGLTPGEDVTIEFKSEASELAALYAANKIEIAMLPEPYVTTVMSKNDKVKIALSLTEEWNKVQPDFKMLTGSVIVRSDFLEKNKAAVDAFMTEYKASVEYINNNVNAGAALVGKYDIAPEAVAKQAIPRCNIVFITGDAMKKDVSGYLNVLLESDAKSIGGKLPEADFYFK